MRTSSAAALPESRQRPLAITLAEFAPEQAKRADELRTLLRVHLPRGYHHQIAEVIGTRVEEISRQLSGERRLTEDLVAYSLHIIKQQEGSKEAVNRIRELTDVIDLERPTRITLVLHPDGRCEWEHRR